MNSRIEKGLMRTVLAASIAAIGATALPAAWADDDLAEYIRPDSEIEVGIGYVSDDSFRHGQYTGLHRDGVHLIGNILINKRSLDDRSYIEVEGSDIGLDSRSLGLRAGQHGNYEVRVEYDQIPRFQSDSYQTPFNGAGTAVLTNPGITRATTSTLMRAGLEANLKPYDLKTMRKGVGLGLTKELARGWETELNVKRETKEGSKLTGAMIQGNGGGDRRIVLVPEPIDYVTNQYDAKLRYTQDKLQLQFGYHASFFENAHTSLTWDNLFTGTNHPATGRFALPPDNQFHQLNLSGSYTITQATRLSGALSYGRMTQNEAFLPFSTQGTGANLASLPATSLNGKVNTLHASLRLNTKLTPNLGLTTGLRYNDRDNKTPEGYEFRYVQGDSLVGQGGAASGNNRRNVALDVKKQELYADLDYRLTSATKLKFGYDFHKVTHNYEPTTGDKEHTLKTEVRHRFGDTAYGGLSYAYSDRDASAYHGELPLLDTYSLDYLRTLFRGTYVSPDGRVITSTTGSTAKSFPWLEAPTLRKFFLADRKRDKIGAFANYSPIEQLDLQFATHYNRDRYPDTIAGLGLTRAEGWMASFDANLQATETLSGNFFASVDQSKTAQNVANLNSTALATAAERGAIPAANLAVTTITDRTLTLGLGMRYKPNPRYEVGATLTHSDSVGRTKVSDRTGFPDLVSRLNRLDLFSRYALRKDMTVNVRYAYERYRSRDWAWDALPAVDSISSMVNTMQTSPRYDVHFVGVSLAYKF